MVKRTKKTRRKKKTISKKKGGSFKETVKRMFTHSPKKKEKKENNQIYKLMMEWFELLGKTKFNRKTGKEDLKEGSTLYEFLKKLPGILHGEKLDNFVNEVTEENSTFKTGAVSSNSQLQPEGEDEFKLKKRKDWWTSCTKFAGKILEIDRILGEELYRQSLDKDSDRQYLDGLGDIFED